MVLVPLDFGKCLFLTVVVPHTRVSPFLRDLAKLPAASGAQMGAWLLLQGLLDQAVCKDLCHSHGNRECFGFKGTLEFVWSHLLPRNPAHVEFVIRGCVTFGFSWGKRVLEQWEQSEDLHIPS